MKKIKLFMVVCLLGIAATASAQFANANSSSNNSDATAWTGLRVSYLPLSIKADGGGSIDLTGFQLGYVKAFAISANAPIFVETGLNVSYMNGEIAEFEYDYDEYGLKFNMFSLNVPVNLGYKYAFSETASIFPYAGLTLRGNLFGNYKMGGESVSIFDDEFEDGKAKRFQIGWQIGIAASFNQFVVGASYGTDFNDIIEGGKFATPAITIGYNF